MPLDLPTLRARAAAGASRSFFEGISRVAGLAPQAQPARYGLTRLRDLPYRQHAGPAHTLDVWRPIAPGPHPVVMYIHGGSFRILSKDTHWIMALTFARAGYVVFNVNYRLAPRCPYPGALEDVGEAYAWVLANAARFGGDPARLIVAGESAGGNLALALTLACCQQREEPWAARVYNLRRPPDLVIPACGLLQTSEPQRYDERPIAPMMRDLIHNASRCYLGGASGLSARQRALADPLCVLESDAPMDRPLPPIFAPCGGGDPIAQDTERLGAALTRRGAAHAIKLYGRAPHAFHAFIWREDARACWRDTLDFARDPSAFIAQQAALKPPRSGSSDRPATPASASR